MWPRSLSPQFSSTLSPLHQSSKADKQTELTRFIRFFFSLALFREHRKSQQWRTSFLAKTPVWSTWTPLAELHPRHILPPPCPTRLPCLPLLAPAACVSWHRILSRRTSRKRRVSIKCESRSSHRHLQCKVVVQVGVEEICEVNGSQTGFSLVSLWAWSLPLLYAVVLLSVALQAWWFACWFSEMLLLFVQSNAALMIRIGYTQALSWILRLSHLFSLSLSLSLSLTHRSAACAAHPWQQYQRSPPACVEHHTRTNHHARTDRPA